MRKFLTKLGNHKLQKQYSKMIFQQFWKKTQVFARYFHENINFCIEKLIFPSNLKVADVTPAFKKKSKASKGNYRPISILPNISKIYERCLFNKIQTYFDEILCKYQCGFCNGFNAQQCLVSVIEKWKESVDNDRGFGTLMTDLSNFWLFTSWTIKSKA